MIEAKTKTIEAKTKTIEAKCLSEAEIIKLIDSKLLETKTNCPISEPGYVTVNNKCIYLESLNMSHTNAKKNCLKKMKDYGFGQLFEPKSKSLYIKVTRLGISSRATHNSMCISGMPHQARPSRH